MADSFALKLKINGADVAGWSSVEANGRGETIECLYFKDAVRTAREKGTALASGRRTYEPIVICKRIDQATPLIAKALSDNETVECEFNFYQANAETGVPEHFFTIQTTKGRVAFIERESPDATDPASSEQLMLEKIGFVFHTVRFCHETAAVEHEDKWSGEA